MQVHESSRSKVILFFESRKNDTNADIETDVLGDVDLTQSWFFDFGLCRPDSFFPAGFIESYSDRDVHRYSER